MYSGRTMTMNPISRMGSAPRIHPESSPFCRERLHLTTQSLSLPQGLADSREHLREVAADLAVDADRHHHPVEVLAVHPLGHGLEGVLERQAQATLEQCAVDLLPEGSRRLLGHVVQGLRQGVPG